jgi:SAM-dependent methyltransferase
MIDLPDACQTALLRAREAGVGARLRVIPGDFTRPLDEVSIEPADVVLLSGILADWSVDDCAQILANAARSLRPGGRLLVSETLLDDARTGPTLPALLSLLMLAAMPGDSFTLPELTELLGRADFAVIAHHAPSAPGRRDLIIAQRHRAKGTSPDQKTLSRDRL